MTNLNAVAAMHWLAAAVAREEAARAEFRAQWHAQACRWADAGIDPVSERARRSVFADGDLMRRQ